MAILAVIGSLGVIERARADAPSSAPCFRSGATPRLASRPIVAFGDSVTWGVNSSRNCVRSSPAARPLSAHLNGPSDTTYPADLSRLLHAAVLDYGVRGETTDGGLKRIANVLSAAQPAQVLVLEGFADVLRGDIPTVIASRLVLEGQLIQSFGARPILLTLYPPTSSRLAAARIQALDRLIRNQGSLRGFRVIDLAGVFHGQRGMLANGLYPTDAGYRMLAGAVAAALQGRHT